MGVATIAVVVGKLVIILNINSKKNSFFLFKKNIYYCVEQQLLQ